MPPSIQSFDVTTLSPHKQGVSPRLSETFAPCLSLILKLRDSDQFGDGDLLRSRILDMLKQAEQKALMDAIPTSDISDARFAIVAFLDEVILGSNWDQRGLWVTNPLQVELYGNAVAGNEFFERLERLKADASFRKNALEVYYLCLALGFKGKFHMSGSGGEHKLLMLIDDTYARISAVSNDRAQTLAPHGLPHDQTVTEIKRNVPSWVIMVAAAGVGLIVYVVFSISMGRSLQGACSDLALLNNLAQLIIGACS